jgi:hypothetical protein
MTKNQEELATILTTEQGKPLAEARCVFLSICLSVFSVFLSFVFLSFCLFVFLSFCLSVFSITLTILTTEQGKPLAEARYIVLSICLSVYLSICLSVLLSFCLFVFLSFCVFLSFISHSQF